MVSNNSTAEASQRGFGWRKSHYSNACGSCVELAHLPDGQTAIRDSKNCHGPALIYPRAEITAFIQAIKIGEFEHMLGDTV